MRIPMEDWLRGCVYHDGRHGEVTLSADKVLEIADYIQLTRTNLADGMIELPPYEPQTDGYMTAEQAADYRKMLDNAEHKVYGNIFEDEPQTCDTCRFELYCPEMCDGCCEWDSHYEPRDKPKLCRECDDYAGDGMYCASNHLVYDFSTSRENCETERSE